MQVDRRDWWTPYVFVFVIAIVTVLVVCSSSAVGAPVDDLGPSDALESDSDAETAVETETATEQSNEEPSADDSSDESDESDESEEAASGDSSSEPPTQSSDDGAAEIDDGSGESESETEETANVDDAADPSDSTAVAEDAAATIDDQSAETDDPSTETDDGTDEADGSGQDGAAVDDSTVEDADSERAPPEETGAEEEVVEVEKETDSGASEDDTTDERDDPESEDAVDAPLDTDELEQTGEEELDDAAGEGTSETAVDVDGSDSSDDDESVEDESSNDGTDPDSSVDESNESSADTSQSEGSATDEGERDEDGDEAASSDEDENEDPTRSELESDTESLTDAGADVNAEAELETDAGADIEDESAVEPEPELEFENDEDGNETANGAADGDDSTPSDSDDETDTGTDESLSDADAVALEESIGDDSEEDETALLEAEPVEEPVSNESDRDESVANTSLVTESPSDPASEDDVTLENGSDERNESLVNESPENVESESESDDPDADARTGADSTTAVDAGTGALDTARNSTTTTVDSADTIEDGVTPIERPILQPDPVVRPDLANETDLSSSTTETDSLDQTVDEGASDDTDNDSNDTLPQTNAKLGTESPIEPVLENETVTDVVASTALFAPETLESADNETGAVALENATDVVADALERSESESGSIEGSESVGEADSVVVAPDLEGDRDSESDRVLEPEPEPDLDLENTTIDLGLDAGPVNDLVGLETSASLEDGVEFDLEIEDENETAVAGGASVDSSPTVEANLTTTVLNSSAEGDLDTDLATTDPSSGTLDLDAIVANDVVRLGVAGDADDDAGVELDTTAGIGLDEETDTTLAATATVGDGTALRTATRLGDVATLETAATVDSLAGLETRAGLDESADLGAEARVFGIADLEASGDVDHGITLRTTGNVVELVDVETAIDANANDSLSLETTATVDSLAGFEVRTSTEDGLDFGATATVVDLLVVGTNATAESGTGDGLELALALETDAIVTDVATLETVIGVGDSPSSGLLAVDAHVGTTLEPSGAVPTPGSTIALVPTDSTAMAANGSVLESSGVDGTGALESLVGPEPEIDPVGGRTTAARIEPWIGGDASGPLALVDPLWDVPGTSSDGPFTRAVGDSTGASAVVPIGSGDDTLASNGPTIETDENPHRRSSTGSSGGTDGGVSSDRNHDDAEDRSGGLDRDRAFVSQPTDEFSAEREPNSRDRSPISTTSADEPTLLTDRTPTVVGADDTPSVGDSDSDSGSGSDSGTGTTANPDRTDRNRTPQLPDGATGGLFAALAIAGLVAGRWLTQAPAFATGVPGGSASVWIRTTAVAARGWLHGLPRYLPIPGYSRYDDTDPLENETRATIFEAVEDDPGIHVSRVVEETGISRSTARYHLRILEHEHLLVRTKIRGKCRLFPVATDDVDVELEAALRDDVAATVLETVAECEPATGNDLATALERDPSTITHHLARLEEAGLIERERDGRSIVNRLASRTRRALGVADDAEGATDTGTGTATDTGASPAD